MYVQSRSRAKNNPQDFIGRNRRAVREQQQQQARTTSRQRDQRLSKQKDGGRKKEGGGKDTVEITKNDLEKLLKMAASLQQQPTSEAVTRVAPNPALIPGLEAHYSGQQPQISGQQLNYVQSTNNTIQETKNFGEETRREKKTETRRNEEEYYPWGRPGAGAPIRTTSGTLLTNYSTRGQEVEIMRESGFQRRPNLVPQSDNNGPTTTSTTMTMMTQKNVSTSQQRPQFARGFGPHVDSFVLSQREEARRKEQKHKDQLAAQIAERKRQKEEEKRRREEEELEAERRVRRDLELMNLRNQRDREMREQKEEEERQWKADLQNRIQEAEDAAVREKHQLLMTTQQFPAPSSTLQPAQQPHPQHLYHPPQPPPQHLYHPPQPPPQHLYHPPQQPPPPPPQYHTNSLQNASRYTTNKPSRIPLPSSNKPPPPHPPSIRLTSHNRTANTAIHKAPQLPPVATETTYRPPYYQQRRAPSPVVPALAKKLGFPITTSSSNPKPSSPPPPPPSLPNLVPSVTIKTAFSDLPLPTHQAAPSLPPPPPAPALRDTLPPYMLPSQSQEDTPTSLPPLPPLPPAPSNPSQQNATTPFPSQPPSITTTQRKQQILTQIALLREGIVSQRKSLDNRINHQNSRKM